MKIRITLFSQFPNPVFNLKIYFRGVAPKDNNTQLLYSVSKKSSLFVQFVSETKTGFTGGFSNMTLNEVLQLIEFGPGMI